MVRVRIKSMPKCERENTSLENKSIEFVSIYTWGEKWKGKIYFKDYQEEGEDLSSLWSVLIDDWKPPVGGLWQNKALWLANTGHVTCILASDWPLCSLFDEIISVCDYLCLSLSKYGLLIFSNLGKMWMKTFLTQGAILWVSGVRKWMLSTRTVTQMLK